MKKFALLFSISCGLLLSSTAWAQEEEEGFFSRGWRGFKSAVGLEADTREQEHRKKMHEEHEQARDKHEDKEREHKAARKQEDDDDDVGKLRQKGRFSSEQASLIRRHLSMQSTNDHDDDGDQGHGKKSKAKKLPYGLQKKLERGGSLPPGWQKKFARGEVVSDEVWAQSQFLSRDLAREVGVIAGTELIQVNDKVARVLTSTREILDVIDINTGTP